METTEAAILSLAIRAVVALLYIYHLKRAYQLFVGERSRRSFRNLIIAVMLAFSLTALIGSSMTRVNLLPVEVALFVGYMVFGSLLITGIFLVYSWRTSDAVQKRKATKVHVREQEDQKDR